MSKTFSVKIKFQIITSTNYKKTSSVIYQEIILRSLVFTFPDHHCDVTYVRVCVCVCV